MTVPIGSFELALATGFVLVSATLSLLFSLGIFQTLWIATIRTYVQLLALGLVLRWIFSIETPWLVVGLLLTMTLLAVHTLLGRSPSAPGGLALRAFTAVFTAGFTITFAVTMVIVRVDPWYQPRYVIPLAGMVIGNSMNGISITLETLFSDLKKRTHEIQMMLALGASAWEASLPSIQRALRTGMIPIINSMSAVGLVFIPGMMTGQILAGADPTVAAGYQIVVMLMLCAATAIGSIIIVLLSYRCAFDSHNRLISSAN